MGRIFDILSYPIRYIYSLNTPTSGATDYKSDGTWNNNGIYPGQLAVQTPQGRLFTCTTGGTINEFLSSSSVYGNFLPISGGTVGYLGVTSLSGSTEKIITTSGSSLLQSYLTTDSEWITNSTIISALLNQSNWLYDTYTGSTTGLIEGQKYACCNYLYIYTNSTLYRYKNANPTISLYSSYTTAGTNSDVVFVSGATPFTLMMPAASSLVLGECRLKNIGPADVTLSATSSTFDGNTSLTATTGSSYCLVAYVNNYYLL